MGTDHVRVIEDDPDWWPNPHEGYSEPQLQACVIASMIRYLTTGEYVTYVKPKNKKGKKKNGRYTPPKR